jgi:kynureninase
MLRAPEGTVTTCESVTAGLYSLIGALPPEVLRGRRLLVAGDCFPSLHFLLAGLQDRLGFTLETVPLRPGAFWVEDEDVMARWGEDVGLALLTWVSSTSSHRCDLAVLVAHGRRMGSLVGVDITQGAGLLAYDVGNPAVDFTLSTSLKWMCGTPGAGMLHVSGPLIAVCQPELRGWFSQPNPFSWDLDAFDYAPDIRRFDNGTPSIMACAGSVPALEWHAAQNAAAVLAHNRALSAGLIEAFDAAGLPLAGPRAPDRRGGSVMAQMPDPGAARAMVDHLRGAGVSADARGRILRLSPGSLTTAEGVARVAVALRQG